LGYRLTKIYTKTGDNGTTGLGINERIAKDSLRIQAIGDIDELNSTLGFFIESVAPTSTHRDELRQIQHDLFDLGGELAMPDYSLLDGAIIDQLEALIDRDNAELPPLTNFILPGGNEAAARCHMAREDKPHTLAQTYLNRLSDYLFVLARLLVQEQGDAEVLWQSRHRRDPK